MNIKEVSKIKERYQTLKKQGKHRRANNLVFRNLENGNLDFDAMEEYFPHLNADAYSKWASK